MALLLLSSRALSQYVVTGVSVPIRECYVLIIGLRSGTNGLDKAGSLTRYSINCAKRA